MKPFCCLSKFPRVSNILARFRSLRYALSEFKFTLPDPVADKIIKSEPKGCAATQLSLRIFGCQVSCSLLEIFGGYWQQLSITDIILIIIFPAFFC